jgi:hypothetical protein
VISHTDLRDVRTHCSHYSRDLVTKYRRHWNDIVSSEEKVGVTQARGLHVDEDFASDRRSDVHVLEIEPATECVNYKCLHLGPPSSRPRINLVFQAAGRGTMGWRFADFEVGRFARIGLVFGLFFSRFTPVNLTRII